MAGSKSARGRGTTNSFNHAVFDALGIDKKSTKEGIKRAKAQSFSRCEYCGKEDENIKKCAKCKVTFYCSHDCQRADWKFHKADCGDPNAPGRTSDLRRLQKFKVTFEGNTQMTHRLSSYLAMLFDLFPFVDTPKFPEKVMYANVHATIVPAHEKDGIELTSSSEDPERPITGIFQIEAITPCERLDSKEISSWHTLRNAQVTEKGSDTFTIVTVMQFREVHVISPLTITREQLVFGRKQQENIARSKEENSKAMLGDMASLFLPKNTTQALTHFLDSINSLIRMDSNNAFRMQTTMKHEDIEDFRKSKLRLARDNARIREILRSFAEADLASGSGTSGNS